MALQTASVRQHDTSELVELGHREPLRAYLKEMWGRREFVMSLSRNDLRARHMNSVLGQAWYLMNPALNIAVYFLIFGVVFEGRRGVENYMSFLVTGVMFFRLMQNTVITCSSSMTKNMGLIRSIQFPRALIPVSIVIENVIQFIPSAILIVGISLVDGGTPGWHWLGIPLVIATGAGISLGMGFTVARVGASLTDLQQLLPHVFRLLLYVSGVLFSVDDRIGNETIKRLFPLNPFYDVVAAARWAVSGRPVESAVWVALVAWLVVSVCFGLFYFRRAEHRYGA